MTKKILLMSDIHITEPGVDIVSVLTQRHGLGTCLEHASITPCGCKSSIFDGRPNS